MNNFVPKESVVLVTGGAGFIGSHVADRLLASGCRVIILDNLSTGRKENINADAIFYNVDVSHYDALRKIFEEHTIDYVIHEAAKINLNVMLEDPIADVNSSVIGTLNLLRYCVEFKVKKIVYASSVAVYGRIDKLPAAEAGELAPIYSYGIAKKCAEEYVRYFSDYYGLNYSILRYANVYGPRQPIFGEVGVIAIYTDRVIKGEALTIFGDGHHQRDYIYIDDVVDITMQMMCTGDKETINVGIGHGVSTKEMFAHFCSANDNPIELEYKPERLGEIGSFYCDITKLAGIIHNMPKTTIEEGIVKTLSFYKALH